VEQLFVCSASTSLGVPEFGLGRVPLVVAYNITAKAPSKVL
jgi:hypothetical protein